VVVADDDVLVREGIVSVLSGAGYEVVGQACDADELGAAVRDQAPDLAVIDIRMPPTHTWEGLDAAHAIRAEAPQVGILLRSTGSLRLGPDGRRFKSCPPIFTKGLQTQVFRLPDATSASP
jgi:DNA-binding NarL/FixJ family response regulator